MREKNGSKHVICAPLKRFHPGGAGLRTPLVLIAREIPKLTEERLRAFETQLCSARLGILLAISPSSVFRPARPGPALDGETYDEISP